MSKLKTLKISKKFEFTIFDGDSNELLDEVFEQLSLSERLTTPFILTAIHIGGLMNLDNGKYQQALKDSSFVYADGISVVLLSKLAGLRAIRRTSTTDFGSDFIRAYAQKAHRQTRIAMIGGHQGLASNAGLVLEKLTGAKCVFTASGFHSAKDWDEVFEGLRLAKPDIVAIGLGAPIESILLNENFPKLPAAVYLTCGGWFGFLVGEETRAPLILRVIGLEWLFRLIQDPRRLFRRYSRGFLVLSKLTALVLVTRLFGRDDG
jgi:N-acetylglucosaminyldiphosphoundecaprenol N-acetyl-beta-D-mannosaminyltransferase